MRIARIRKPADSSPRGTATIIELWHEWVIMIYVRSPNWECSSDREF
jgi:hypothetical protein